MMHEGLKATDLLLFLRLAITAFRRHLLLSGRAYFVRTQLGSHDGATVLLVSLSHVSIFVSHRAEQISDCLIIFEHV